MKLHVRNAKKNDIPIILGLLYELGRPKPKDDSDLDSFKSKFQILIKLSCLQKAMMLM
jgi:N-acetylglutamate synthase-like GNAT family acetyltransferase